MAQLDHFDPAADADERPRVVRPRWRAAGAAAWAVAGAVGAGGGWWLGLVVSRRLLGGAAVDDLTGPVIDAALLVAGLGAGWGTVVGGLAAFARGGLAALASGRAALVGAVAGALGAAAGGLGVVAVAATAAVVPAGVSSSLAWAAVGLVAGAISYTWGRKAVEAADEEPAPAPPVARAVPRPAPRPAVPQPGGGPAGRVLPAAAVAGACLVGAVIGTPSPAGWAVLAVGVLGLTVVWALVGQERQLRELERRLPPGPADARAATDRDRKT